MGISGVSLDKNAIIAAVIKNKGCVAYAAEEMECHVDAIFGWARRDEDVRNAIIKARKEKAEDRSDIKEVIVDKAYKSVIANLDKFDVTTTIFVLKCLEKWMDGNNTGNSIILKSINRPYDDKIVDAKVINDP